MLRLWMLAVAVAVCGCATPNDKVASEPRAEKEYRTGSNIPVPDRTAGASVYPADPQALERSLGPTPGRPVGTGRP